MLPLVVLCMTALPAIDAGGTKPSQPIYIPAEAPYGYLYQPAFDIEPLVRMPATLYLPQPGDIVLMSDTNRLWTLMYRLGFTGKPGHAGMVVLMPDGQLGFLEAGYDDSPWTRVTPLDFRLNHYPGTVWVRPRCTPLTVEQNQRLTEFAMAMDNTRYAVARFMLQTTQFKTRGPLRTFFLGRPRGISDRMYCGEAIIEGLVYAGVIDGRTARPRATYPQDLFYDESRNIYINRHPPLAGGWAPPSLWTPLVGSTALGKDRPKPPSPWPGVGALVVDPGPTGRKQAPAPVVVGYVPGELRPVTHLQQPPQRIGIFDRPPRGLRRR